MTIGVTAHPVLTHVTALYDYEATQANQLSLKAGDRVAVYKQEESGWWSGMCETSGESGWFPATYVEEDAMPSLPAQPECLPPPPDMDMPPPPEHSDWQEYTTEDQQVYYVHRETGESRWSLPEPVSAPSSHPQSPHILTHNNYIDLRSNNSNAQAHVLRDCDSTGASPSQSPNGSTPPTSARATSDIFFHKRRMTGRVSSKNSIRRSVGSPSVRSTHTAEQAKESAVETDGRYGYANNFWSDKGGESGFDILVKKHRTGKEVCKDITQFMTERARIEDIYAKSLMNLAKSHLGTQESGTAKTAWNQLKFDLENQARARMTFVEQIQKQVQAPLVDFKNEQKKMRKNYEATIAADRKLLLQKYNDAQKLLRVYHNRIKDAEAVQVLVQRGQLDTMTRRDFMKIEDQARKERKKAAMAGAEYKLAVEQYEKVRIQWEEDMTLACQEFEGAEVERIEYIKKILHAYLQIQMGVNNQCKESTEMVENSIDAVSEEVDIEMFVKSFFTGSQKPLPLAFEPVQNYI